MAIAKQTSDARRPATELTVTESARSWREGIESVVIAIVLAFLFRAFEAEAFVIPTGSMAPTLQGRHKDVVCPECKYRYRAGASSDGEDRMGLVEAVTCPLCFFTQELDPTNAGHVSNTGDRILVNKFAYEEPFGQPQRWDVVVFKYPGNAKQNYIKRLVGLDNETVQIHHGDIFVRGDATGAGNFEIARKPPDKLERMLQLVNDTEFRSNSLDEINWPANWQALFGASWTTEDKGRTFRCEATAEPSWLRFQQYYMSFETWQKLLAALANGEKSPPRDAAPLSVPVTDFYPYNGQRRSIPTMNPRVVEFYSAPPIGMHWVGDLAVEAGRHHRCSLDVISGTATLTIDGGSEGVTFRNAAGETYNSVVADTPVRGPGRYAFRFANVDDQLTLWVNGKVCQFDRDATYAGDGEDRPRTSPEDGGDLQPIGLGAQDVKVRVSRLRVLRDIYYIATTNTFTNMVTDYGGAGQSAEKIIEHLVNPTSWKKGDLFDRRSTADFQQMKDQFFVLGDNSPQSQDGRLWGSEHFVDRDLLIGEAVLIYWPHPLQVRIPFTRMIVPWFPNVREMKLIH